MCIGQCVSTVVVVVVVVAAYIIVSKYMMIIRNVCSFPEGIFLILSTKVIVSSLYIVHKLNTYQGGHVSLSLCLKSDILKFPVIRHLLFRFFKRCYIATASVTTLCATCLPVALTSVVKTVES